MYLLTKAKKPVPRLAYTLDQACEAIGYTRSRIYQAIACGDLQTFKTGKRRMILARELERFIDETAQRSADA